MRWKLFLILWSPVCWSEKVVISGTIAPARLSISWRSTFCGETVNVVASVAGRRDANVLLLIVRTKRLEYPLLKLVNKVESALLRSVEHEEMSE